MRERVIKKVIKLQRYMKYRICRRKIFGMVKTWKNNSATTIQKFARGYKTWKKYNKIKNDLKVKGLLDDYIAWRFYHQTALHYMLRYYFKRYKIRKEKKAAAAKAKKDALAKKKRSRTVAQPVIEPLPVKGKKGKNV
jgi:hypothetical protein